MAQETVEKTAKRTPVAPIAAAPAAPAGIVRRAVKGLGFLIGIGLGKTPQAGAEATDQSTRLAEERTNLALERNYMAAERTLMGWIRTTLAMISFGFTLGKLGQALRSVEVKMVVGGTRTVSVESLAYFLVILGTLALLAAAVQHRLRMQDLYARGLRRQISITFVVAVMLTVVGGFAFTALVMHL